MLVLGIETSCDDTGAAVLRYEPEHGATRTRPGRIEILSNVLATQLVHREFDGVVPELASRAHLATIRPVLDEALRSAGVALPDLSGIAVTMGPGLVGSLLVGLGFAKSLAYSLGLPFVGVNHLEGHLVSAFLEHPEFEAPCVTLIVSGGHTEVVHVPALLEYRLLGSTRDDAAGEAFDKVAVLLGLGYPGGALVDRLARSGNPRAFEFPRARLEKGTYDTSFSGLKTAVRRSLETAGLKPSVHEASAAGPAAAGPSAAHPSVPDPSVPDPSGVSPSGTGASGSSRADVAASFEAAVVDVLIERLFRAVEATGARGVSVVGGVAANTLLRERVRTEAGRRGLALAIPSLPYCADNAAMIALAGALRLDRGESSPLSLNAVASIQEIPL
jgi:N6-L-threonylcarbamoyladenine synthase